MNKHYICKEELNEILDKRIDEERITKRVLSDVGCGIELARIDADSLNTVTKFDICRDFLFWFDKTYGQIGLSEDGYFAKEILDRYFKMENEDGQTHYM